MRLAEVRRRTGYSARGFAKATGSSTRTIWELEKGRRIPRSSTIRKLAEVLAVPAGEVEEFREAIKRRASRDAPPEVLVQVEQMDVSEVDLVDATVIRVAAQRSLREVMEYLVRAGHAKDVDRIYRDVCEDTIGQEEARSNDYTEGTGQ